MTEGTVDVGSMGVEFDTASASAAVKAAVEAADAEAAAEAPAEEQEAPAEEKGPDTEDETPAAKKAPKGKEKEPPAEEPAQTASEIQRVLKEREQRRDAQRDIAEMRAQIQAEFAEAKRLRAETEQERTRYRQALQDLDERPVEWARTHGKNPDDFILQLAHAGTPEGKLALQLAKESRERSEIGQQLRALQEEREQEKKQAAQAANEASIRAAEQRFLGFTQDAETCPTLARLFKGREHVIIAEGHRVAQAYHAKTGQIPNERDIAEYLESEWAENGSSTTTPAGKAPQRRASGSATVTPAEASERRTVAKSFADMSDDDRMREAKAAAAKAIKEASGTR